MEIYKGPISNAKPISELESAFALQIEKQCFKVHQVIKVVPFPEDFYLFNSYLQHGVTELNTVNPSLLEKEEGPIWEVQQAKKESDVTSYFVLSYYVLNI